MACSANPASETPTPALTPRADVLPSALRRRPAPIRTDGGESCGPSGAASPRSADTGASGAQAPVPLRLTRYGLLLRRAPLRSRSDGCRCTTAAAARGRRSLRAARPVCDRSAVGRGGRHGASLNLGISWPTWERRSHAAGLVSRLGDADGRLGDADGRPAAERRGHAGNATARVGDGSRRAVGASCRYSSHAARHPTRRRIPRGAASHAARYLLLAAVSAHVFALKSAAARSELAPPFCLLVRLVISLGPHLWASATDVRALPPQRCLSRSTRRSSASCVSTRPSRRRSRRSWRPLRPRERASWRRQCSQPQQAAAANPPASGCGATAPVCLFVCSGCPGFPTLSGGLRAVLPQVHAVSLERMRLLQARRWAGRALPAHRGQSTVSLTSRGHWPA